MPRSPETSLSQPIGEKAGSNGYAEVEPVLEAVGLSRSFGPIEVLSDVSIAARAGEVHAIIGENGAGKSALMKIIGGHLARSRGWLKLDGSRVEPACLMAGRDLLALYPVRPPAPTGAAALEVSHFTVPGYAKDASFSVRPGEILGSSGLVGAGHTELFEALFGLRKGSGEIRLDGAALGRRSRRHARRRSLSDRGPDE